MPVRSPLLLALLATFAIAVPAAAAPPVKPSSIDVTGKIGTVVTDQYDAFGLLFSDAGVATSLFADSGGAVADSWVGTNPEGGANLDLPVNARIVVPGTGGDPAFTSQVTVEAGFAAPGALEDSRATTARAARSGCEGRERRRDRADTAARSITLGRAGASPRGACGRRVRRRASRSTQVRLGETAAVPGGGRDAHRAATGRGRWATAQTVAATTVSERGAPASRPPR